MLRGTETKEKSGKEIVCFPWLRRMKEKVRKGKGKGASTFCIFPPATHSWFSDIILMEE